jgi:acyl-CoA reductase-like NAD-dependent aldehyde dehydrogenase
MRRAVAFCQVIEPQPGAKIHKVSSKSISDMFAAVVDAYQARPAWKATTPRRCAARPRTSTAG